VSKSKKKYAQICKGESDREKEREEKKTLPDEFFVIPEISCSFSMMHLYRVQGCRSFLSKTGQDGGFSG
jgi:hypothetical protein